MLRSNIKSMFVKQSRRFPWLHWRFQKRASEYQFHPYIELLFHRDAPGSILSADTGMIHAGAVAVAASHGACGNEQTETARLLLAEI